MEGTQELQGGLEDTAHTALDVFFSWAFTPTGALLLVLAILFGGAGLILRVLGMGQRFARLFITFMSIAGFLFFIWVVSGILEVWGIPVREWITQIGGMIPELGAALLDFFKRLLFAAG